VGNSRRGWGWCHVSTPAAIVTCCSASPSAAIATCAPCSFTAPAQLCAGSSADATDAASGRAALKLARGFNVAAVALANKNARIIWALLTRGDNYRPAVSADLGNKAA